jgi:hypothetical protein
MQVIKVNDIRDKPPKLKAKQEALSDLESDIDEVDSEYDIMKTDHRQPPPLTRTKGLE